MSAQSLSSGLAAPGGLGWFAAHELRLAWRDWMSMMTAGKRAREWLAIGGTIAFVAFLHWLAFELIKTPLSEGVTATKATLTVFAMLGLLSFSLMLSQAIESVTRAFYSRADLDLLLSSPASSRALFSVRIGAIVLSTAILSLLLALPFVHMAVWLDGVRWLAIIPLVIAMATGATALSIVVTVLMFRSIGARRTRLIAQILAAVVGAAFLIGTQVGAILFYGQISRIELFSSEALQSALPGLESWAWVPARAALGDAASLLVVIVLAVAALGLTMAVYAGRFGEFVLVAASVGDGEEAVAQSRSLHAGSAEATLRAKEWRLLARDPWLISQTLMQVLYLVPPAVLLWQTHGAETGALVVLAPVLVMAVGQLSGGLAWLAVSGEDAPDLIDTAPIKPKLATNAKVQSVITIVMAISAPLLVAIAIADLWVACVTFVFLMVAAYSAILIQLWFRRPMSRSQFRRRQTASRTSTIAEAFASILWAGAAVMAASGTAYAGIFVVLALGVLLIAWSMRPTART
ncbi:MAG: permease [Pseudomonadota bacterium]